MNLVLAGIKFAIIITPKTKVNFINFHVGLPHRSARVNEFNTKSPYVIACVIILLIVRKTFTLDF